MMRLRDGAKVACGAASAWVTAETTNKRAQPVSAPARVSPICVSVAQHALGLAFGSRAPACVRLCARLTHATTAHVHEIPSCVYGVQDDVSTGAYSTCTVAQ